MSKVSPSSFLKETANKELHLPRKWFTEIMSFLFPEITDAKHCFIRYLWFMIYVTSLVVFVLQFWPLLQMYVKHEVTVSMKIEHASSLAFPQVTICKESSLEKMKIKAAMEDNLYQLATIDYVQEEYIKKIYARKNQINFDSVCSEGYVLCEKIDQCIAKYWICDGKYDCFDYSDESEEVHKCSLRTSAEPSACVGNGFQPCSDNPYKCARFCDGTHECDDSSDEKDCIEEQDQTVVTASNHFQKINSHEEFSRTDYPLNYRKVFIINSPKTYVIIRFSHFDLEPPENGHCYDYLEITDGDSNASKFCGTNPPSNGLYKMPVKIEIFSDFKMVAAGFSAEVKNVDASSSRRKRSNNDTDIVAAYDRIADISGTDWKSVYYIMRKLNPTDFSFANTFALFPPRIPFSYGASLENLILTCNFGPINCATITRSGSTHFHLLLNSKYGKCFTFNSEKAEEQRRSSRSGTNSGLTMVMFLKDFDSIGFLSKTSGISLTITPPSVYPLPSLNNIIVQPGTSTKITLTKRQINRLRYPFSTCTLIQPNWHEYKQINDSLDAGIFSKEHADKLESGKATFDDPFPIWKTYNQQVCTEACLYENLKLECGCVDSYIYLYYHDNGLPETPFPICSPWNTSEILCKEKVYNKFRSFSHSLLYPCNCPQSCSDIIYDVQQYSSDFPSRNYLYYFINEIITSASIEGKTTLTASWSSWLLA